MQSKTSISLIISLTLCCFICEQTFASNPKFVEKIKQRELNSDIISEGKQILISNGYDVNDVEHIKRAALAYEDSYHSRDFAIRLLVEKLDEEAIPTLIKCLNDPHPSVRRCAASFLGIFGNRSGIETMRKDIEELSKNKKEYEKIYKELSPETNRVPVTISRLNHALRTALVLAELGDTSGFQLAAQTAIESKNAADRGFAILVLTALTRIDDKVLKENNVFPEIVLFDATASEMEDFTLKSMLVGIDTYMQPKAAFEILEKLQQSSKMTDGQKHLIVSALETVKVLMKQQNISKGN